MKDSPAGVRIRPAMEADLPAINDIYNYYVVESTCTYQVECESAEGRKAWFQLHGHEHPVVVAEFAGEVVGWGALSRFHPRAAYERTVEDSIYVRSNLQRRGIGGAILADLIGRARKLRHRTIVALISADQAGSIALHARSGFHEAGRLAQVGRKLGQWLDVVYMQLML